MTRGAERELADAEDALRQAEDAHESAYARAARAEAQADLLAEALRDLVDATLGLDGRVAVAANRAEAVLQAVGR